MTDSEPTFNDDDAYTDHSPKTWAASLAEAEGTTARTPAMRPAHATPADDHCRRDLAMLLAAGGFAAARDRAVAHAVGLRDLARARWSFGVLLETGADVRDAAHDWARAWFEVHLLRVALHDTDGELELQRALAAACTSKDCNEYPWEHAELKVRVGLEVRAMNDMHLVYAGARDALMVRLAEVERVARGIQSQHDAVTAQDEDALDGTSNSIDMVGKITREWIRQHGTPALPDIGELEDPEDEEENPYLRSYEDVPVETEVAREVEALLGIAGARLVLRHARTVGGFLDVLARWAATEGCLREMEPEFFVRSLRRAWDFLDHQRYALEGLAAAAGDRGAVYGSFGGLLAWAEHQGMVDNELRAALARGAIMPLNYAGT